MSSLYAIIWNYSGTVHEVVRTPFITKSNVLILTINIHDNLSVWLLRLWFLSDNRFSKSVLEIYNISVKHNICWFSVQSVSGHYSNQGNCNCNKISIESPWSKLIFFCLTHSGNQEINLLKDLTWCKPGLNTYSVLSKAIFIAHICIKYLDNDDLLTYAHKSSLQQV